MHPGGPFFARRDEGVWSVAKGLIEPGEDGLKAAQREFVEETGFALPPGPYLALDSVKQKGGKVVEAWAVVADFDPAALVSNTFEREWPPRSGRMQRFPEIDRGGWFELAAARRKLLAAQQPFLDRALALRSALFGRD